MKTMQESTWLFLWMFWAYKSELSEIENNHHSHSNPSTEESF